jgi:hypothetical protein
MRRTEQVSGALLGLILLVGAFDVCCALRVERLQKRLSLVTDSAPGQALQGGPRRKARAQADTHSDIFMAPEVTTRSGREARLKAPDTQVNSVPVQAGSFTPLR